jgi:hypothetical protein
MEGSVLSWTRIERPPAGFAAGRVVVLVAVGDERRYALWEGAGEPVLDAAVRLEPRGEAWVAR